MDATLSVKKKHSLPSEAHAAQAVFVQLAVFQKNKPCHGYVTF